jgi:hypothetical protein
MKTFCSWFGGLCLALLFSGCVDVEKVITLNADGSGTLVETAMLTKGMYKDFEESVKLDAQAGQSQPQWTWLDKNFLRERASKLGAGVSFVSAQRVSSEKFEGWSATYAFTDIGKLKVDQSPFPLGPHAWIDGAISPNDIPVPMRFEFQKGSPSELIVNLAPPAPARAEQPPSPQDPEQVDEFADLLGRMLKDARIAIAIDFPTAIVQTDARFHEGRRVTLMDLDFNKLLADPARKKKLSASVDRDLNRKIFEGVPGVKLDPKDLYHVRFETGNP